MSVREPFWRRLAPTLVAMLIRLLGKTMRMELVGGEAIAQRWREGRGSIVAFWHGRQLMMAQVPYGGRGVDILISRHRDGELISRAMRSFGYASVRGSTTRGGAVALKEMIQRARAGRDVVITPDGPKGPRHIAQPGVIQLAKATGLPIFPVTFGASKKKFCRRGTASSCRTRSRAAWCSGGNRFGFRGMPTTRSVRPAVWLWNAR